MFMEEMIKNAEYVVIILKKQLLAKELHFHVIDVRIKRLVSLLKLAQH